MTMSALARAIRKALEAPTPPALARTQYEAIPPRDRPDLRFRLQPSLSLIEAGRVVVRRRRGSVVVEWLPAAAFALLAALHRGETLSDAAEAAFDEDPGFNVVAAINTLLDDGSVVGVDFGTTRRAA
jgi:hypothetical protein